MAFNSIVGLIQFGTWELGAISSIEVQPLEFIAVSEPTCVVTFEGGIPLRSFSSVLGTFPLGRFELAQISLVNPQAVLGRMGLVGTADATCVLTLITVDSLTVTGTTEPTGLIVTGLVVVGTAEPTCNINLLAPITFVGSANPTSKVFFDTNELQPVIVDDPLQRTLKLVNFTY